MAITPLLLLALAGAPAEAAEVEPAVPVMLLAAHDNGDEDSTLTIGTNLLMYNLLSPGSGMSATFGPIWTPTDNLMIAGMAGMGVSSDEVWPSLNLQISGEFGPVYIWTYTEYDVALIDNMTMAELFFHRTAAVGGETEVMRHFDEEWTWFGAGPNLMFTPNDSVYILTTWLFVRDSDRPDTTIYTPRLELMFMI